MNYETSDTSRPPDDGTFRSNPQVCACCHKTMDWDDDARMFWCCTCFGEEDDEWEDEHVE